MRCTTATSRRSAPRSPDATESLAAEIKSALGLADCRFEPFPFDAQLPRIERDRIVLPVDEPGTRPYRLWHPAAGIDLPVRHGQLTLGRFVLVPHTPTCGVAISLSQRSQAIAIADRAGRALGRQWTASESAPCAERKEDHRV